MANLMDLFPTILDLAGVKNPPAQTLITQMDLVWSAYTSSAYSP